LPTSDAIRDPERLALLRRTRLLDAPPEPAFDRLTRLASRLVNAPIALVTLIDEDRQFFLSCVGLPEPLTVARQTPLSYSLCKHLVATDEPLIISDLRVHPVLRDDATLQSFGILAYAGIPLRTATGHVLGSFCVLDVVPRDWTQEQIEMLTTLANSAISEIELRSALDRQAQKTQEIASSRDEARATADAERQHSELLTLVIDAQREIAGAGFSLDAVLHRVAVLSARLTGADGAGIVTSRGSQLEYIVATAGSEHLVGTRVSVDGSIAGLAMRTGRAVISHDAAIDPRVAPDVARNAGVRSVIAVPLDVDGEVLGAVIVGSRAPNAFNEAQGKVLQLLAGFVGVAIRRVEEYDAKRTLAAERTAALERLRVSEERFRLVERATNDVIYDWNVLTGELALNEAVHNTLRLRPHEMPTVDAFAARIHQDDAVAVRASLTAVLGGEGDSWSWQYRFRRGDGSIATILDRGHILRDSKGRAVRMIGSMADLTERKRTEEALREASETVRALVDASPLAIIVSDFNGIIHVWNAAAERMFGWAATEVLGKSAPHIPDDLAAGLRELRSLAQQGQSITGQVSQRIRRDGSRIDVDQSMAPLRDASGRPNFLMSILADITEQRQLEGQLRQSQKMEAVGRLAGGIAHDFNNLLTVIRANADFLSEDLEPTDERRGEIDEIRQAADRAASLTRQLLVFSRRQVVQPKTVQLNDIVGSMEQMLGRLIGEDIVLASVLQPDLGTVHADVSQMEQILLNLVVNARDAMPVGGAIVIATEAARLGPEALGWQMPVKPGNYVHLTVSDTGSGMTAEIQAHIFEPFFTTKEPGKGTGLGLSTVYGIVQQMDGSVVVRSEPDQGTIFSVYLPIVVAVDAVVAQPVENRAMPDSGTETILLVEDEHAVRRLARRALEMSGYRILEASHGGEALRVCAQHPSPIDLLLTDVVMPQMSGAELAERLKPLRPDMRVLYMSGYTEDALGNHGVLSPETAFLYKPFTPDSLRRTVRGVLDR
jgi:two-component system cell cycle sensor histidine kinase/response regulator CckA